MPTLGGAIAATLVGLVMQDLLQPLLGFGPTAFLGLIVSTLVYVYVRRWLADLRGG